MNKHITVHPACCSVAQPGAHIPVRSLAASLLALAALAFATPAFADGNAAAGKEIATKVCAACHSLNGISNKGQDPQPPILAGQYKDYLVQALHEYKLNQRKGSPMNAMVAPLSEQDIKDVAEYFAGLPGPLDNLPHGN